MCHGCCHCLPILKGLLPGGGGGGGCGGAGLGLETCLQRGNMLVQPLRIGLLVMHSGRLIRLL